MFMRNNSQHLHFVRLLKAYAISHVVELRLARMYMLVGQD
jgi:hypothetical protein